jgi:hypothetical protein
LHYSGDISLLKLLSAKGYSVSRATPVDFLPSINTFPASLSRSVGQSAILTVNAFSETALGYQWKKSGVPMINGNGISGVTTSSLSLFLVQPEHAGDYSVTVSNSAGSVTSPVATLTVTPVAVAPSINTHPQSLIVTQGQAAQFGVTALGTAPSVINGRKVG